MTDIASRRRRLGMVAAAAVGVLALGACAAAEDGDSVASAGDDPAASPAGTPTGPAGLDPDEQALRFAGCMRENGVDMPDPAAGQSGLAAAFQSVAGNYDRATLERAIAACQDLLPQYAAGGPHGDSSEEWQLAVAECLREQGLEVSDDLFADLHSGEIDQQRLAAAMEKCRNVVSGGGQ